MNTTVLVIIIAVAVVALGAVALYLNYRSRRLRSKFGPEYTRAVEESGSKYRAETKLEKLEKRVEKLSIQPLSREDSDHFRDSWRAIQAEFVDDPRTALNNADRLLAEVMSARGYPVVDFEERAAEISVHHASVVDHYRAGHEIAVRHAQGHATTEDMRLAMIHYRTLFDDLVGAPETVRVRGAGNSR
jgi:FtsZ-interacting cell division protein ZipA